MSNRAIIVLALVTVGVCNTSIDLHTKLGWPVHYWRNGNFAGFVVLACVLWWSLRLMIRTVNESRGPLFGIILVLAIAAGLLQYLPDATSGIQLLPIAFWRYAGWMSAMVAILVWLSVLLAVWLGTSQGKDGPACFSIFMLVAIGLNSMLSFSDIKPATVADAIVEKAVEQSKQDTSIADYELSLDHWISKANGTRRLIQRLELERNRVTESILVVSQGNSPTVFTTLIAEQDELTGQIERLRNESAIVDAAVVGAESHLRRMARKQLLDESSVVTESEYESLSHLQRELQDLVQSSR